MVADKTALERSRAAIIAIQQPTRALLLHFSARNPFVDSFMLFLRNDANTR
jgi:hypothetical protein